MIHYGDSIEHITRDNLRGFCVGWRNPPGPGVLLEVLRKSDYCTVAIDDQTGNVVGLITCITDNVLFVYIPLLEVLPAFQSKGIGAELMRRVKERFKDFYKIDLCCDEALQNYYERFGMKRVFGMTFKNYEYQCGEPLL